MLFPKQEFKIQTLTQSPIQKIEMHLEVVRLKSLLGTDEQKNQPGHYLGRLRRP